MTSGDPITQGDHLAREALERASVDEATADEQTHLSECETCRDAVRALQAQAAAFAQSVPFSAFSAQPAIAEAFRTRDATPSSAKVIRFARRALMPTSVALAAGLAAVFVVGTPAPAPDRLNRQNRLNERGGAIDEIRLKGEVRLEAIRLRGTTQTVHKDRVPVRAGDRLRFRFTLPEAGRVQLVLHSDSAPLPLTSGDRPAGAAVVPADAIVVTAPVVAGRVELTVVGDRLPPEPVSLEIVPQ